MRIMMVAAEAAPYVKVGGLADVVGSLARLLPQQGSTVELILPGFDSIDREKHGFTHLGAIDLPYGGRSIHVELSRAQPVEGLSVILVEDEDAFGRPGIYDDPETKEGYGDNAARFAFFARVAAEMAVVKPPDVLHAHDSHGALVPALLKMVLHERVSQPIRTVLTIHNLAYQMPAPKEVLYDIGFTRDQFFPMSPLEYHGNANFLKTGIQTADAITTVSERYASEIQTEEFGCGLEGLLRYRRGDLFGILNGIDTTVWDPSVDPLLPANYSVDDLAGKRACRQELLNAAGLTARDHTPVIGMVGRLTEQKGIDIFAQAASQLASLDVRFAILGSGQDQYHQLLSGLQQARPDKFAVYHGFNEELAHRIEAGSDFFLMPSRFEPCGLNQMYSMRYGTIPIVRRTGGLADTVSDQEETYGRGTGFVFDEPHGGALAHKVVRAIDVFHRRAEFDGMVHRGMHKDFSAEQCAARYLKLYHWLARR